MTAPAPSPVSESPQDGPVAATPKEPAMSKKKVVLLCCLSFLAGCLALLAVAYFFGPREEECYFDLYTGSSEVLHRRLGHRWTEKLPDDPHVAWAEKHRQSKFRSPYYVRGGVTSRGWFFSYLCARGKMWDIPRHLFSSMAPEAEKVRLLRIYHAQLDAAVEAGDAKELLNGKWATAVSELLRTGTMTIPDASPQPEVAE